MTRRPYDGKPYYCNTCNLGLGEYGACEELDCELESTEQAMERKARQKPVRLRLSRRSGFKLQDHSLNTNGLPAVMVARPSRWGNPFRIGKEWVRKSMTPGGGQRSGVCGSAEDAVRLFKRFTARETDYQIRAYQELRGKNLACWCPLDALCHADVLLEIANGKDADT